MEGAVNSTVELRIFFSGRAPTSETERFLLLRDVEYLVVCETVVLRTMPWWMPALGLMVLIGGYVMVKWGIPGLVYTVKKAALLPTIIKKN